MISKKVEEKVQAIQLERQKVIKNNTETERVWLTLPLTLIKRLKQDKLEKGIEISKNVEMLLELAYDLIEPEVKTPIKENVQIQTLEPLLPLPIEGSKKRNMKLTSEEIEERILEMKNLLRLEPTKEVKKRIKSIRDTLRPHGIKFQKGEIIKD